MKDEKGKCREEDYGEQFLRVLNICAVSSEVVTQFRIWDGRKSDQK